MISLGVVGGGPRGLGLCLRALLLGMKCTLIDPFPLSTWTVPNILDNMQMRSPITFDLVTGNELLSDYSLVKYLGIDYKSNSLIDIEGCPIHCDRKQFLSYLHSIYSLCITLGMITLPIKMESISKEGKYYRINPSGEKFDKVVLCLGNDNTLPKWWSYMERPIKNKLIGVDKLLGIPPYSYKSALVIGSGQSSAEYCYSLSTLVEQVVWLRTKTPRIAEYPVPSIKDWGYKSVFSDYFYNNRLYIDIPSYLSQVKQWQPTITPYINNLLHSRQNIDIHNHNDMGTILGFLTSVDIIMISVGLNNNMSNVNEYFRRSDGIYVSGLPTILIDGPRQGSLFSINHTCNKILEDIYNDYK